MDRIEAHEKVSGDLLEIIESWEEQEIEADCAIHSGLSLFLRLAYEMSSSKEGFFVMLVESFRHANVCRNNNKEDNDERV